MQCSGLAGRPLRRSLLLFLWLSMVYGVFHFMAREDPAAPSLPTPAPLYDLSSGDPGGLGPEASSSSNAQSSPASSTSLTLSSSTITTLKSSSWSDEEPLVDKETRTIEELILEAAGTIRNIPHPPYILGGIKEGPKYYKNSSCARFPTIYDLEFSNSYWQVLYESTI